MSDDDHKTDDQEIIVDDTDSESAMSSNSQSDGELDRISYDEDSENIMRYIRF